MALQTNSNTLYTLGKDKERAIHSSWYRGKECNFLASKKNLAENAALDNYVVKGWMPTAPFITRQNQITTFGSCFAQHISQFLTKQSYSTGFQLARRLHKFWLNIYNSHIIRFGEGMVNTFALRQQFEWAYTGKSFSENLWHDSKGQIIEHLDEVRVITREIFDRTDIFIITLGLSEVWHNKKTEEVFDWGVQTKEDMDEYVQFRKHMGHLTTK